MESNQDVLNRIYANFVGNAKSSFEQTEEDFVTLRTALASPPCTDKCPDCGADMTLECSGLRDTPAGCKTHESVEFLEAEIERLKSPPCVDVDKVRERIKVLMEQCGHANSTSVYTAFMHLANEFSQGVFGPSDAPADVWQQIKPLEWTERNSKKKTFVRGMKYCHTAVGFYEIGSDGFVFSPYVCKYPSYDEGLAAITKDYTDKVSSLLTANLIRT